MRLRGAGQALPELQYFKPTGAAVGEGPAHVDWPRMCRYHAVARASTPVGLSARLRSPNNKSEISGAKVIEHAAFALVAKGQTVPDAYRGYTNSFNSEMMSAREEMFQRRLPR